MTATLQSPATTREAALDASGWGREFKLYQPRNLAFWVYMLLILIGVMVALAQEIGTAEAYAPALIAGTIWFTLYGAAFWWFIRHLDRYAPLPTSIAIAAFAWGGLVACFALAVQVNTSVLALYSKGFGQAFMIDWGPALTAPFTEEFSKAAGLILLITLAPQLIRSAFDGFILGAFIGLGFQIVENIQYTWQQAANQFGADQGQAALFIIGSRSAVGLASHTLFSAIFCSGVIYLLGSPAEPRRVGRGIALVLTAMVCHGVWDGMAAIGGGTAVGTLLIPVAIVIELLIFRHVYRMTVPRERDWLREVMAPEVETGAITKEELVALAGTRKDRKAYVKSSPRHATAKHVLDAARDLAKELARAGGRDTADVQFARSEVARVRA